MHVVLKVSPVDGVDCTVTEPWGWTTLGTSGEYHGTLVVEADMKESIAYQNPWYATWTRCYQIEITCKKCVLLSLSEITKEARLIVI
jgi:hypothetical protein